MRARKLRLCTLATRDGAGLGVLTERGIVDVAKANALFRMKAPADIHAVYPVRHQATARVRAFVDHLATHFSTGLPT